MLLGNSMKLRTILIILVLVAGLYLFLNPPKNFPHDKESQISPFGADDQNYALAALQELDDKDFLQNRIPDVDDDFMAKNASEISLAKVVNDGKEHMSFFNPVNTDYWPYYYYTNPYQYKQGGAWPPGMQSRLYNWQPGFGESGWSYWLRPGITYDRWPRNRWVKNNGSYFYINNGSKQDRLRDYTGEPS